MIYGVINHNATPYLNGLFSLKKISNWENFSFTENHFKCISVGFFNKDQTKFSYEYFFDQLTNWSIFVFGKIYNLQELFGSFQSQSLKNTPQLLLSLFQKEGNNFAEKLNGDFIIIISTVEEKNTYVFRDHLGIMPFSYTILNDVVYFCSDTLSLCRALYPQEPINPEFLLNGFKFTDKALTPNKKVKRLLPGHYLQIKNNTLQQHKYWFPERIKLDNSYTKEKVFREATALIEDAIAIRVDKNLKAASHVSGGLDSSMVAALTRKQYVHQTPFYGFSWSPEYSLFQKLKENDERESIKNICEKNHIEKVFSTYSLDNLIFYTNNPFKTSSFVREKIIQEFAKKNGIQLIFSGYGGDEFISCGTYGVFIDLLKAFKWKKYWQVAKTWSPITILKSIILDFLSPTLGILPLSFHIQNQESTRFIKKPFKKNHKPSLRHFFLHKSRKEMHLGMLYNYHIPLRTEEWYNWGSKYGVQYRYPLLDKRIVEFMLKIPSDYLYQGSFGRVLLREAAKEILPEDVRWSTSKTDPALFKYVDELVNDFFLKYNPQLEDFKKNPALDFFDFKKFETAISKEKRKSPSIQSKSIISTFIQLKYLHEFTKQYAE